MRFDLNLIAILEAIMQEKNVTRAAGKLAMSQPAVSNALRRARRITKDDLFVKVAGGVRPTARMMAMWPDLQASLQTMRTAFSPEDFDPRSDVTSISLAVTDSLAAEVVSAFSLQVLHAAPFARVKFAIHTNPRSLAAIERGALDCAIGMFPAVPTGMHVRGLLTDRYVCVMRKGHPLSEGLALDDFVEHPQVLVTPSGHEVGVIDGWLTLQQRSRNTVIVVNHFADALRIVTQSDLLTCVPEGLIRSPARSPVPTDEIRVCQLPFETERLLYKLVWHDRVNNHPAHRWFRDQLVRICESLNHELQR